MTEYEIATLAIRETTLLVAVVQVGVALAIGAGQIGIVWYGIRAMQRAGDRRAKEQDQRHAEAMDRLERSARAGDQRHAEAMDRFERLARAGDQRHAEAMDRLERSAQSGDQRHAEAMDRLERSAQSGDQRHAEAMRALEALITRPAAPAAD